MGNIAWKEWEHDLIEQFAGQGPYGVRDQLRKRGVERSLGAIRARAGLLGIQFGQCMVKRPWTEEEEEVLRQNYLQGYVACWEILRAKGYRRTDAAVARKLQDMGLQHRACVKCGKLFRPLRGQDECRECREHRRPPLLKVICATCGREFKTKINGKNKCPYCVAHETRVKILKMNLASAPSCPWETGHIKGTARDADFARGF